MRKVVTAQAAFFEVMYGSILPGRGACQAPPPDLTRQWGHARWNEESSFMDLTHNWHLGHSYHHHPVARLACLLILFLAFIYTAIFFSRNLRPVFRGGMTRLHFARLLADDLAAGSLEPSFWAQPP